MLGLRFCARAFSSCVERGPLFIAVRRLLTIAASLVAEHRLQTCRLSSCGSRARLLRGMWEIPRPGLEPVSPALVGRLSTTAPPGKPKSLVLKAALSKVYLHKCWVGEVYEVIRLYGAQFLFVANSIFIPFPSFGNRLTQGNSWS